MYTNFYSDRKYIQNEYEDAEWNESTGLAPSEIDQKIRAFAAENPKMPAPLLMANLYKIMLENAQLGLNPHTMFPDKLRHGGTYIKDAKPSVLEMFSRERYEKVFDRRCGAVRAQRRMFILTGLAAPDTDVWHIVIDWNDVINLGAKGLLDRIVSEKQKKVESGSITERQTDFYNAEIIAFEAMLTYMNRLLDESERMGLDYYSDALRVIINEPPKTLYQVLCLCHIVLNVVELGRERCRTYGPVDEMYAPFYTSDKKNGILTKESATEMFRYFWQKVAAEKRYADQPICIGKAWKDDTCDAAELTEIMLDAYTELKIHNPKIHIRCGKNMSDKLLTRLVTMIQQGSSSMVLVNDKAVFAGYEKIGIQRDIADKYVPIGCYESTIMGLEDSRICASWINLAKACEYAITGGWDILGRLYLGQRTEEPKTWEEFLSVYYSYLKEHCELVMNNVNVQAHYAYEANPSPYYSGTIRSCVEGGKDVFDCGMEYRNQSIKCFAIATAVDSLLAVKKFVYERGRVTLAELRTILENNWQGSGTLRAEIMKDPVKYGNNIDEADDLARDIFKFCANEIIGKPTSTGGVFRFGCDSVNMAEGYGSRAGATADGRLAREPLSKNMRPVNGMEKNGVTAFIQSVTKLDNTDFVDGAPLDFIVHPSAVEGEAGINAMKSLIRVFFEGGGFAIQGNIVNLDTLLDAKAHPEKYPTLQVRVCGWNEYWVNMNAKVQDDFIKRTAGIEG
ncbi:MAG: hypothetical protein IJ002_07505 [Clostridia bacterium]|nr:hypothetical protein [Clostridia bacterium]